MESHETKSEKLRLVRDHSEEHVNHNHSEDEDHDHAHKDAEHEHSHGFMFFGERTELIYAVLAAVFLVAGYSYSLVADKSSPILIFLYSVSYLFGGFFALIEALENLKAKRFEIDTLMLVAAAGAAILGEWAEGSLLLVLFSLGHAMEHYAMGKAKKAIEELAKLAPKTAHIIVNGQVKDVDVATLKIGDTVLIKPNEYISVDGTIVKGRSLVNQASITGESMPVEKDASASGAEITGSKANRKNHVFAGTINGNGVLEVKVSVIAANSTLYRIAKMAMDVQAESSPTQEFTKKIEKYFVPSVLILVVLMLGAFLVISEPFSASFYRAMAVLVAASPCALAISTPSAVLSGIARAGRVGILFKGGAALENFGKVDAMAFDKTGTLTQGKPTLKEIVTLNGISERDLLMFSASVESASDHPLAQAIVNGAKALYPDLELKNALLLESLTGSGVQAELAGRTVLIAKPNYFAEIRNPISEDTAKHVWDLQNSGNTVVVVSIDRKISGLLAIRDVPRESSKDALELLKNDGIKNLTMLSGDNQLVATSIAKSLGLSSAKGELMPEDKVGYIKDLREKGHVVAMIGDGVNDAPAMAASSVGVAMGAAGSDVALETSDVALMSDDLRHLVFALKLSRKASSIIRQNLIVSMGVVAFLVPATILGLKIGPAVMLHEGSTLVVVFNALRLLTFKNGLKN